MMTVMGNTRHQLEYISRQKMKQEKVNDHQELPYCVQVYVEESWCMSWSECCGVQWLSVQHVSDI